jgi:hypothetical protein
MWLIALLGCAPDEAPQSGRPLPAEVLHIDDQPGHNPLVPGVAAYPFPSDLYMAPDATSLTGRVVALPPEVALEGLPPELFAGHDGFTRAPALLAWFPGGVDPDALPDLATSVDPAQSPILLVREGSLEPVPVLAEVDATTTDPDLMALILRPAIALEPNTAYAVIIRESLVLLDGTTPVQSPASRALFEGIATDSEAVEAQREDFALVLHAAESLDVDDGVLGWTFHTRSEEQVTAPVLAMHDRMLAAELPPWKLVSDTVEEGGANRLIEGTIVVPDYLDGDRRFVWGSDGLPEVLGEREVAFLLTIPVTVTEPRPVMLFGHGFFSQKEETTWGSLQHSLQPWAFSALSTDFLGFNEADSFSTIAALGGDLASVESVVAQQLQSHIHFTALSRLVQEQLGAEVVEDRGEGSFFPLDPEAIPYMGISNGGTQGSVIAVASPLIDRAALVVPGGAWSHMLQRAVQWNDLGSLLEVQYPHPLELQLALSLAQQLLDPVDIINYAAHLGDDPYPGRNPKRVTFHEAVGDSQVANITTEWVARSAGLDLVVPTTRDVWGLPTVEAPMPDGVEVAGALLIYDEGFVPETTNVPPAEDNGAHESIRYLDAYTVSVGHFLETGRVVQACDGPCDPD